VVLVMDVETHDSGTSQSIQSTNRRVGARLGGCRLGSRGPQRTIENVTDPGLPQEPEGPDAPVEPEGPLLPLLQPGSSMTVIPFAPVCCGGTT
jgi:hypothetical protein